MTDLALESLPAEFATSATDVSLRVLTAADADAYRGLLQANRDHPTRYGDFTEGIAGPREGRTAE